MISETAIVALAGIGTLGVVGITSAFLAPRSLKRHSEAAVQRAAAVERSLRQERLEDARHKFQLETLLELQPALQNLSRLTNTLLVISRHPGSGAGQDESGPNVPARLSQEVYQAAADTRRLASRLLEAELRGEVYRFLDLCLDAALGGMVGGQSVSGAGQAGESLSRVLARTTEAYGLLLDRVGAQLRRELGVAEPEPEQSAAPSQPGAVKVEAQPAEPAETESGDEAPDERSPADGVEEEPPEPKVVQLVIEKPQEPSTHTMIESVINLG